MLFSSLGWVSFCLGGCTCRRPCPLRPLIQHPSIAVPKMSSLERHSTSHAPVESMLPTKDGGLTVGRVGPSTRLKAPTSPAAQRSPANEGSIGNRARRIDDRSVVTLSNAIRDLT